MKDFNSIPFANGTYDKPADLVEMYLRHEAESDKNTIYTFLSMFSFESREDVSASVRKLAKAIAGDKWMSNKDRHKDNILVKSIFTRYNDIVCKIDKFNKMPNAISGELWHGGYSRKMLQNRTEAFYKDAKPDAKQFAIISETIKRVYSLSDTDINKLHFFVEQVKAGNKFPNSLRRMLYIWGVEKMTGKTTSATMLTCLLNGDTTEDNIARYSTNLANEMQIGSFKVPLISECNVCLMDECFYADMGKTYADFKRFMTSANGTARLPYGQTFNWVGQPNYVATSNDSLQKFIKDWNDRRFLSVEFTAKPTINLTFAEIKELWRSFILNSERTKEWKAWADELAPVANEIGERQERSNEFAVEMRQEPFLNFIDSIDIKGNTSSNNPANHVTLKKFVDFFSRDLGNTEAQKRRGEIESAVLAVYCPRYSSTNYWLATDLKRVAVKLREQLFNHASREEAEEANNVPF